MSTPTPAVSKPEIVSLTEATTVVLRSHTQEGRSSAVLSEIETLLKIVVPVEIHTPETPG